jgi:quinol monooxygenase YgiN
VLNDIIRVVALWRAEPAEVDQVREILGELAELTRREPGCVSFEVLEAARKPGQFVLLEQYAGERDWQRHRSSEHFRALVLDRAVPLLTHRDVEPYVAIQAGGTTA